MLENFGAWLNETSLAVTIRTTGWMFPTFESIHVFGLTIVVGMIAIMDLRLLGYPSNARPVSELARETLRWVWLAFVIAVISGVLMFVSQAQVYVANTYFLLKMGLIVLAGLNMIYFELFTSKTMSDWDVDVTAPRPAKFAAIASLSLWIGVVVFGRLIGFTLDLLAGSDLSQYLTSM